MLGLCQEEVRLHYSGAWDRTCPSVPACSTPIPTTPSVPKPTYPCRRHKICAHPERISTSRHPSGRSTPHHQKPARHRTNHIHSPNLLEERFFAAAAVKTTPPARKVAQQLRVNSVGIRRPQPSKGAKSSACNGATHAHTQLTPNTS